MYKNIMMLNENWVGNFFPTPTLPEQAVKAKFCSVL